MAEICRFNGIRILMYEGMREHPPPHFHAVYGDDAAAICIFTGRILCGQMKSARMKRIRNWRQQHQKALEENWQKGRTEGKVKPIPPP